MIRGRAVTLRPVEPADHSLIHAWRNHPEVWRRVDDEVPATLKDVSDAEEKARAGGRAYVFEAEGAPLGRIALEGFRRRDRRCALSLLVGDRQAWAHASDAVEALLAYAFERHDLHQVEATVFASDDRTIATLAACGFVREATLRDRTFRDGAFVDHVVMSVTREEFEAARSSRG